MGGRLPGAKPQAVGSRSGSKRHRPTCRNGKQQDKEWRFVAVPRGRAVMCDAMLCVSDLGSGGAGVTSLEH